MLSESKKLEEVVLQKIKAGILIQVKRACSVHNNSARNNFSFIAGINSTSMLGAEINAVYVTRNRDLFIGEAKRRAIAMELLPK